MGMKPPKGHPKKIGGTVSSPKDTNNYKKIGNASTAPKDKGVSNLHNSGMPKPKAS